jgi:putative membrane protein
VTPSEVRRLHPLSPFFELILLGKQFLVPLVLLVVANRGDGGQFVPAIPVAIGAVAGFLKWLRFTYTLDGDRLVIDEGVFTRKQRVVPLDRIQQVEMISKLRHRLLGVTVLRVDTAGGGGSAEVDLSVVSVAEAGRLRTILLPEGAPATPGRPIVEGPPLVHLGVGELAVAGMTGAEMAVMLTILFWFLQLADDLPGSTLRDLGEGVTAPTSLGGFVAAGAVLVVVWFGLAATASVLKHFGFTMRHVGDDLRVARGLFDRREGSMPVHRIQAVRVQAVLVRRLIGRVAVGLQSAGGAAGSSGGVSRIDVPILDKAELPGLLAELLPAVPPEESSYVAAPAAARRRAIVRRVVPALVVAGVLVALRPVAGSVVAAVALVGIAALAGELAYRGLAHAYARELVLARAGGLARETVIVPVAKAQSTRLRTTPFQRRAGLATLYVDVAGKGATPQIRDGDVARLRDLQRAVLLASPAARADEQQVRARRTSGRDLAGISAGARPDDGGDARTP